MADSIALPTDKRLGLSRWVRERLLASAVIAVWLLFWEFSVRWGWLDDRFFASPSVIFNQFLAMLLYNHLAVHISVSAQRLLVGYLLGTIPALLLGIVVGRSQWLRAGCGPLLLILMWFPSLALYPVIMVIFGLGEWSKWLVVAMSTFFWMLYWTQVTVVDSLKGRPGATDAAGRYAPYFVRSGWIRSGFFGLKLATWVGLLTLMPAEFVGAKSGIGYVIWQSWMSFGMHQMYVGIVLAGILGGVAWLLVDLAERLTLAVAARRATRP